jgi:hypothetical protein
MSINERRAFKYMPGRDRQLNPRRAFAASFSFAVAAGLAAAFTIGPFSHGTRASAITAAPRAALAAGCQAAGCDGQDPVQMGCDKDKTDVQEAATKNGNVVLYYSPTCHAAWAAETVTSPGDDVPSGDALQLWYEAPFGGVAQLQTEDVPNPLPSKSVLIWTVMANWDDSVKACEVFNPGNPGYDPDNDASGVCTEWY